jgi:transmembrane sensor
MSVIDLNDPINYQQLKQAAQWFAIIADGEATEQEHQEFDRWLQSNEHSQAWAYVEGVSQQFSDIRESEHHHQALTALASPEQVKLSRRSTVKLLSISVLAALGCYKFTGLEPALQAAIADYSTAVGQITHVKLPDHSQLSLNTASAINVNFNDKLRLVELIRGEILIDTVKDERHFEVATSLVRLRALGTHFSVTQLNKNKIKLSVYQGRVAIYRTDNQQKNDHAQHIVAAGQQVMINNDDIEFLPTTDIKNISWQQGVLLADEISIAEFVEQLSRYRSGYLGVSPDIAEMKIMGTFPLTDTDKALAMLTDSLPVKMQRITPWWLTIEAK